MNLNNYKHFQIFHSNLMIKCVFIRRLQQNVKRKMLKTKKDANLYMFHAYAQALILPTVPHLPTRLILTLAEHGYA